MPTRRRDRKRERTVRRSEKRYQQLVERVHTLLGRKHVDLLRSETGYNPRQRVATAHRLLLTCVEGCLSGQTLGFSTLRAFFVKRFGPIRPRAFQLRFKSSSAVAFFERALSYLVAQVLEEFAPPLTKTLSGFADIHVYDASQQRVPARGRKQDLCSTKPELGGSKWLIGYSLRHGAAFHALGGSGCMPELKNFWHLVGRLRPGVLYLVDLAYFSREMFIRATEQGAFVLMRLKACKSFRKQLHVVSAIEGGVPYRPRKFTRLPAYLRRAQREKNFLIDLDVHWDVSKSPLALRCVGAYHRKTGWRLYLTTVPRNRLAPEQLVATYRLRWLVEFLFREWKQQLDWGRSATSDKHALFALTYAALFAHALMRSLRIATALRNDVPLDSLRPLASLHALRACAADLISAAIARPPRIWNLCIDNLAHVLFHLAYEQKSSRNRTRIAHQLGAIGA